MKSIKVNPIAELSVAGYKSIYEEQKIRIAPLTILAGANSSGKSSFIQPFLLMKQTLESPYDAGVFLLEGENVKITDRNQMFSKIGTKKSSELLIKIKTLDEADEKFAFHFEHFDFACWYGNSDMDLKLIKEQFTDGYGIIQLDNEISASEIKKIIGIRFSIPEHFRFTIIRERCFLSIDLSIDKRETSEELMKYVVLSFIPIDIVGLSIKNIIHLPGLRGNPERAYPKVAVSEVFPGRFEVYTASIIYHWQVNKETEKIQELESSLQYLGLTSKVEARQIYDTRIEIYVGRLPTAKKGKSKDMVNIADVGFGVSQTLPILVALIQAKREHTVYIEQPETHLHPKAQYQLAQLFAKAAKRGVRLIIETHSALILQGIQTLVAKGELPPNDVALHWFSRDKSGATKIDSAELDENGAFGDWPEDFDDTFLKADSAYLDAVESKF